VGGEDRLQTMVPILEGAPAGGERISGFHWWALPPLGNHGGGEALVSGP